MTDAKPWWTSKTIWTNAVAVVALIGARYGLEITEAMQAEVVGIILGGINIVLRLVTDKPIKRRKT